MYIVGKIVGFHGIKGELKVKSDSSFERFFVGATIYLKEGNNFVPKKVSSHRKHKNLDLITLDNQYDLNRVTSLLGALIYTVHSPLDLAPGEYFYEDLIGKVVISSEGEEIGVTKNIREVPQGILLEVLYQERIVLIPFVQEFIISVGEQIVVNLIEGLL